jgi:hypothetical protein
MKTAAVASANANANANAGEYTCPMHPEVLRVAPGSCPKCGMTLVPKVRAEAAQTHTGQGHEAMAGKPGMPPMALGDSADNMMVDAHKALLWPHYLNLMLGVWLVSSPFSLGYLSEFIPNRSLLRVMAERGLSSFEARNHWMTYSDVGTGLLVILFSLLAANAARRFPWAQWVLAVLGGWLLMAPLVFWTPMASAYANDTLVGSLVIALSVLIPMMPGMSMAGMMGGPDVPPGWSYTPSSWLQRFPIALLAVIGFFIARYMGAYQLGHIDQAWDPFFGLGTQTIITSNASKAWPIADGALGAVVYMLELVMSFVGGKTRWRTMPWMVLALAVLILPLGGVSIYFIIIQPIVIGTWCTICLIAGLAMALMIPYSLDEFVAMGQFLADARRKGKPFWRTFWSGDAMEGGMADPATGPGATMGSLIGQAARGVTLPWALLASCAVGLWFMFTRISFGTSGQMANSDHLMGALVVTFALMAFAEVARPIRFINIAFGLWMIAAHWILTGNATPAADWAGMVGGVLLIALSIPRGRIANSYAGWDRVIYWPL